MKARTVMVTLEMLTALSIARIKHDIRMSAAEDGDYVVKQISVIQPTKPKTRGKRSKAT